MNPSLESDHMEGDSMITKNNSIILIVISQGALKNSYMGIDNQCNFFPNDAFGQSNKKLGEGKKVRLTVQGISEPIDTDIAGDKLIFRRRYWCSQFYNAYQIKAGDIVKIEKINNYEYRISKNQIS